MPGSPHPLGQVAPDELVDARLQLHHAAQALAAVGGGLVEPLPDHGHLSLTWSDEHEALAGQVVGDTQLRAALRPRDACLLVLDAERVDATLPLDGRPLAEAVDWLGDRLAAPAPLALPTHALPDHPTADGAPFRLEERAAFEELGHWYAHAARVLAPVHERIPGATPVRCWPHHFDLASRIALAPDARDEEAPSIGVGMAPGDEVRPGPYWYVLPWPPPAAEELPPAPAPGSWHTAGWIGAVLPGSAVADGVAGTAGEQDARAAGFVEAGIATCRELLERGTGGADAAPAAR